MGRFITDEQIERAKRVDVLEYILATEPHNIKRVGRGFRLKDHDSLAVSSFNWYWHSRGIGGKTAFGYLTYVRGYDLVDAVCMVLNERSHERIAPLKSKPTSVIPKRKPFMLPLRNSNNNRVIAYLQSRGIDRDLILDCISRGDLYESKGFHNAVFVGRNQQGKVKFAAQRGVSSSFKCDVEGSDKKCGFILPPIDPNSNEIAVFEAPVDCLSHQTLCKQGLIPQFNGWRLSLGGTSILALEQFLKYNPHVNHCVVCTDDDKAGNEAAARIAELSGVSVIRSLPLCGNDWNDALLIIQKTVQIGNHKKSYERG